MHGQYSRYTFTGMDLDFSLRLPGYKCYNDNYREKVFIESESCHYFVFFFSK